jgi:hypothetical protein
VTKSDEKQQRFVEKTLNKPSRPDILEMSTIEDNQSEYHLP